MQSLDNTQDVAVCRNCLGFVGDLILQLELLSGIPRHECLQRHEIRHQGDNQATTEQAGSLSGLHVCLQGCGEVYCSSECRAEHLKRCHHLLCVGPVPEEEAETHPLVAFRVHAMQTNEIFLLVGEVIAQTVAAAFPSHPSSPDTTTAANNVDLASARAPFVDFVQEPWWDVALPRERSSVNGGGCSRAASTLEASSVDGGCCSGAASPREGSSVDGGGCSRAVSLPETLRGLCEESSALLRSAFGTLPQAFLVEELTAERFGRVVGMFEQNNVGVRVSSPVPSLLRGVTAGPELSGPSIDELAGLVGQIEEFQEDESDCDSGGEEKGKTVPVDWDEGGIATLQKAAATERPDDMFAPLDGTALYSLVCCMNHSCRPNCVVRYPRGASNSADSKASPLVAQVVLIEAVAAGDELTQSYVDKEMGLLERRKALEDYGFLCRCPRCLEEDVA